MADKKVTESKTKKIAKQKNLTMKEIRKQSKKLDGVTELLVTVKDIETDEYMDYFIKHDTHFRKTKIYNVLDDMITFFNEGGKKIEMLEMASPYINLLILKHFTNLGVSEDIDEALLELQAMLDMELLDKIINGLPEKEVNKIYESMTETIKKFSEALGDSQAEAEAILDELENEEIKADVVNMLNVNEEEVE